MNRYIYLYKSTGLGGCMATRSSRRRSRSRTSWQASRRAHARSDGEAIGASSFASVCRDGSSLTLRFAANVTAKGNVQLINTATVASATAFDPNTINNSATVITSSKGNPASQKEDHDHGPAPSRALNGRG